MRTVFNFTARDRISPSSPRSLSFHRGEEEGEEEFRGWDGARFQLSRLKSSAVRARLFNRYLSFTVHDSRNAYECDGPVCIIYRGEAGPALCPRMDGIIRVCATACSSPPPGGRFPLKCQRHEIYPTRLDQFQENGQFFPPILGYSNRSSA